MVSSSAGLSYVPSGDLSPVSVPCDGEDGLAAMYPYQSQRASRFLSLPTELRLQIYSYLLLPCSDSTSPDSTGFVSDHHNYYAGLSGSGAQGHSVSQGCHRTLEIRTLDPTQQQQQQQRATQSAPADRQRLRTQFAIRASRFRARTMSTTYTLAHNPGLHTRIMLACRQCHAEAAPLLYAGHTFSFSTHVECVEPFLRDLTPRARACVRSVGLVKRALPYERESDRADWEAVCAFLADPASGLATLRELRLGVVAGCPGPDGWENVREFSKDDFVEKLDRSGARSVGKLSGMSDLGFTRIRYLAPAPSVEDDEWGGMDWIGQLTSIARLETLTVTAIVEHCPPPMSERMEFWISFSKSVEGGFAEYLQASLDRGMQAGLATEAF